MTPELQVLWFQVAMFKQRLFMLLSASATQRR
jgi:hypothetical protein